MLLRGFNLGDLFRRQWYNFDFARLDVYDDTFHDLLVNNVKRTGVKRIGTCYSCDANAVKRTGKRHVAPRRVS